MKPVALVNPNRMKPVVAPLGLEYLSRAVELQGFEVKLLDLAFADEPEDAVEKFFAEIGAPLAVGISIRNTDDCFFASQDFTLAQTKIITDKIKTCTPAPLVLGGCGFSLMPGAVLKFLECNLGIAGDGEWAFPDFLHCIAQGKDFHHIPGLAHVTDGRTRINRPRYPSLEKLPTSFRGLVDNPGYFRQGGQAGVETKRGCDRRCIYCADPVAKGSRVRQRLPMVVADEIARLLAMGIDSFHTCDSEFNIPEAHALAVCQELIRRKMGKQLRWYAYCSITPFSPELVRLMRQAGCVGINFGMDSGSQRMLGNLGRGYRVEDIRRTVNLCKEQGLAVMLDLLLGGPGETRESIRQTIELVKELGPTCAGAAAGVRIYPGTRLADMVTAQGPMEKNPNLHGKLQNNASFLEPVFYLQAGIAGDVLDFISNLVADDPRFFFSNSEQGERNYNYNDNSRLVDAIRQGARGAYWHILSRLRSGGKERAG